MAGENNQRGISGRMLIRKSKTRRKAKESMVGWPCRKAEHQPCSLESNSGGDFPSIGDQTWDKTRYSRGHIDIQDLFMNSEPSDSNNHDTRGGGRILSHLVEVLMYIESCGLWCSRHSDPLILICCRARCIVVHQDRL